MSDTKKRSDADGTARGKKPYQRPQIVYREPLEAMAALCTPAPTAKVNSGSCPTGPLRS